MIIKMNRKSKGKKGPVEYLLNQRVKEGTAFTLRGNPQITKTNSLLIFSHIEQM